MQKSNKYKILYRKNEETGRVIIDIGLDNYQEFFHEWDNAIFKKRDIHPELAEFFNLCSEDIPLRKDIEIVFSIKVNQPNPEKEEQLRTSYLNYYNSLNRLESRKTKKLVRVSTFMLLTALALLFAYGFFADFRASNILSKVLFESILIGGWVFAWEAVHTLFVDIFAPFHRFREIKRFLRAEITFKYA